jgi:hypothetical protein
LKSDQQQVLSPGTCPGTSVAVLVVFFFLAPQSLYVDNIYRIDLEFDEFAVCRCLQDPPFPGFYDQARSYGSGGKVMGPATCTVYHSLKKNFPK